MDNGKSITWQMIALLQERRLPWPTLYLVYSTITADARASGYSSSRKPKWTEAQWLAFLEEGERLGESCAAALAAFARKPDFAVLNAALVEVRRGLNKWASCGNDPPPFADAAQLVTPREPADVRSITWLLRLFLLWGRDVARPTLSHAVVHRLYKADARAFPLRAGSQVKPYDRLHQECERSIAAFLKDSNIGALTGRLESILARLTRLGAAKA
jgi:hypothetical protein